MAYIIRVSQYSTVIRIQRTFFKENLWEWSSHNPSTDTLPLESLLWSIVDGQASAAHIWVHLRFCSMATLSMEGRLVMHHSEKVSSRLTRSLQVKSFPPEDSWSTWMKLSQTCIMSRFFLPNLPFPPTPCAEVRHATWCAGSTLAVSVFSLHICFPSTFLVHLIPSWYFHLKVSELTLYVFWDQITGQGLFLSLKLRCLWKNNKYCSQVLNIFTYGKYIY